MLITKIYIIMYFFHFHFSLFLIESQLILGKILLFQDSQDWETVKFLSRRMFQRVKVHLLIRL
jgi:hypothetical protein